MLPQLQNDTGTATGRFIETAQATMADHGTQIALVSQRLTQIEERDRECRAAQAASWTSITGRVTSMEGRMTPVEEAVKGMAEAVDKHIADSRAAETARAERGIKAWQMWLLFCASVASPFLSALAKRVFGG